MFDRVGKGAADQRPSERFRPITLLSLFLLASVSPLLFFGFDHWDGVIYHYAVLRDDFSGVHQMHQQVGAFVLNAVYLLLDLIGQPFGGIAFVALPFVALPVFGLGVLSVIRLFVDRDAMGWMSVLIAASCPVAALAASSMLSPLFLLIGIGLFGVSLVASDRFVLRLLGWLLVLVSLTVLHAAFAIVGLAIIARLSRVLPASAGRKVDLVRIGEPFLFGMGALSAMALLMALNPSHGLYQGYVAPNLTFASLILLVDTSLRLFLPSAPWVILLLLMSRRMARRARIDLSTKDGFSDAVVLIGALCLAVANALPFVLTARGVPKPFTLQSVGAGAEDFRYLIMSFAVSQIVAAIVLEKSRGQIGILWARVNGAAALFLFPLASALLWASYLQLDAMKHEITSRWADARWSEALACSVDAQDMGTPTDLALGYSWRFYDLNYLAFNARGKADRFLCLGDCPVAAQLDMIRTFCTQSDRSPQIYVFDDSSCAAMIADLESAQAQGDNLPRCLIRGAAVGAGQAGP